MGCGVLLVGWGQGVGTGRSKGGLQKGIQRDIQRGIQRDMGCCLRYGVTGEALHEQLTLTPPPPPPPPTQPPSPLVINFISGPLVIMDFGCLRRLESFGDGPGGGDGLLERVHFIPIPFSTIHPLSPSWLRSILIF